MAAVDFTFSADLAGSPELAYQILADYEQGHPSILPSRYFPYLDVEQGGRGAGTVIRFGLKIGGRVQHAVADVSEPEPRVLVERVRDVRRTVTTFRVDPSTDPGRVRVSIHTTWEAPGVFGPVERWLAPRLLRPIYREQLENLERAMAR